MCIVPMKAHSSVVDVIYADDVGVHCNSSYPSSQVGTILCDILSFVMVRWLLDSGITHFGSTDNCSEAELYSPSSHSTL